MREYERYEPMPAPKPGNVRFREASAQHVKRTPRRRPKVNMLGVLLGDQAIVWGALLRVFTRRKP